MKKKSIIGVLALLMMVGLGTTSCQDMLLQDSDRYSYTNANDTAYSYWGIMRCMQSIAERQVILNEVRGDLVQGTNYTSDTISAIANFENPQDGACCFLSIKDYYNVINNCNAYLANADTTAEKSNKKYMLPEYKQVMIIRAWTYLQLVQLYGEVPYITVPIISLDVVKNFDGTMLNKDNIVQKLIVDSNLPRFSDIVYADYPSLGAYNNGNTSMSAALCYLSPDVVMGDIYLLANQYDMAAQSYYNYLQQSSSIATIPSRKMDASANTDGSTYYTSRDYMNTYHEYTTASTNEIVSMIPGAANSRFGQVLTKHVNLMGVETSSEIVTVPGEDADGNDATADVGGIAMTLNYLTQQMAPSTGFYTLSGKQSFLDYRVGTNGVETSRVILGGDARKNGSLSGRNSATPIVSYSPTGSSDVYRFINKFTPSAISYSVPIYRKCQIYLRFAEAINRAGHPEYAFAILKDGLCYKNLPRLTVFLGMNIDTIAHDTTYYNYWGTIPPAADAGGAYYIGVQALQDAQQKPYLNFENDIWEKNNTGIHARGCGEVSGYRDTIFTYAKTLAKYEAEGNGLYNKADTIEAIENAIVDEMALELSFEGYRFTDLVRVANHKNNAGYGGTAWLANKVARRNDDGSPAYTSTSAYQMLYQKLLTPSNWYFAKPASYK